MIGMFDARIVETGRLPLFGFFVAFMITFVLTRVNVRLIRSNVRWFRNVTAGDVHIHHVVFGVVLMLAGGVASLAVPDAFVGLDLAAAVVFGMGSALVLDEFALILHLSDVYWTEKGRASVDAVFVAIAVTGLLLLGVHPLGYESLGLDSGAGAGSMSPFYAAFLVVNLAFAVLTLLKGKIWTGLIGLFVPALLVIGAIRVARPGSPWSRWRYDRESRRYQRAVRREKSIRRPLIRGKIWVQEFIAGRHDLIPPELLQRRNEAAERARRRRLARVQRRAAARAERKAASPFRRKTGTWAERRAEARARRRAQTRARRGAVTRGGNASRMRTRAASRRRDRPPAPERDARQSPEEEEPPTGGRPRAGTSG
ncbi:MULTISPECIES: hypothetical protein [unclassified Spirillospora]|uniref:hypothetical protein n=1 Tax=unclassified Spirillospora TaxID=2642701 RepID=UPI0037178DF8